MYTITKTAINLAAQAHAKEILGEEQFKKNKDAVRSIAGDFKDGVTWAMRQGLHVKPADAGHDLIVKERLTHLVRGYDAQHDERYKNSELVVMAILLAAVGTPLEPFVKGLPWPVKGYPDKRDQLDRVRLRVIAGGLLAAQIDKDIKESTEPVEAAGNEAG